MSSQIIKDAVQRARLSTKERLQHARIFKQTVDIEAQHIAGLIRPSQIMGQGRLHLHARRDHGGVQAGLALVDLVTLQWLAT